MFQNKKSIYKFQVGKELYVVKNLFCILGWLILISVKIYYLSLLTLFFYELENDSANVEKVSVIEWNFSSNHIIYVKSHNFQRPCGKLAFAVS